jgi:hypothetical protein
VSAAIKQPRCRVRGEHVCQSGPSSSPHTCILPNELLLSPLCLWDEGRFVNDNTEQSGSSVFASSGEILISFTVGQAALPFASRRSSRMARIAHVVSVSCAVRPLRGGLRVQCFVLFFAGKKEFLCRWIWLLLILNLAVKHDTFAIKMYMCEAGI